MSSFERPAERKLTSLPTGPTPLGKINDNGIDAHLLKLSSFSGRDERFSEKLSKNAAEAIIAKAHKKPTMPERIAYITDALQGIPTKYDTLTPKGSDEKLVVDFTAMDCVTFVETALAMANADSYGTFVQNLIKMRYKNGAISWKERNHYMIKDWATHNAGSFVSDATEGLAEGNTQTAQRALTYIDRDGDGRPEAEKTTFTYIPRESLASVQKNIREGDIIVFISKKTNLDAEHTGFARWKNGELYLFHAKQKNEVQQDPLSLTEYLASKKQFAGFKVLRAR